MLRDELEDEYRNVGGRYILPFIGSGFIIPDPLALRIAAVGINAYLSDKDWADTDGNKQVHDWFRGFWASADAGKSWPFYIKAFREVCVLGAALAESSLFDGRRFDSDPVAKPHLYATNAVKAFLQEEFVDSTKVEPALLESHTKVWHRELDVLAKHGVLPHIIVGFGEVIWRSLWTSLHPDHAPAFEHFKVTKYVSAPDDTACFHHVNRISITSGGKLHTVLLARVAHPSARGSSPRNAAWLLRDTDFRAIARLTT